MSKDNWPTEKELDPMRHDPEFSKLIDTLEAKHANDVDLPEEDGEGPESALKLRLIEAGNLAIRAAASTTAIKSEILRTMEQLLTDYKRETPTSNKQE